MGCAQLLLPGHVLAILLLVVVMVTQLFANLLKVGIMAQAVRLCVAKAAVRSVSNKNSHEKSQCHQHIPKLKIVDTHH